MPEQLSLDFSTSATVRHRRAVAAAAAAVAVREAAQPQLFAAPSADVDVHLSARDYAVAHLGGLPELTAAWLVSVVGPVDMSGRRRARFPASRLHRLLWVRPPAKVTLDAAAATVARAQWAHAAGWAPLLVERDRSRLTARSRRGWPASMRVVDAPWSAVAALAAQSIPVEVAPTAQVLYNRRLSESGVPLGRVSLAGSAVLVTSEHPAALESLDLPGLAYDGPPGSGRYRLPLLLADPLLDTPGIETPDKVAQVIRAANRRSMPLTMLPDGFPWKLYDFQAADAGRALRIVRTTGGVLLAGDMGSGKTTVALALAAVMDTWPLLVVAPLSAFSTWARQLAEMGRSFYVATETPAKSWERIAARDVDAVVISYDRLPAFAELVEQCGFAAVIADEVQRIRTPSSRRSRALRAIAASIPVRIGLSGTPLTNGLADVLPVGAFLAPAEWPPRSTVKDLADVYPGSPAESLAEHLGSMMVRRRMSDIPANLPRRVDHRIYVELTASQRRALDDLTAQAYAEAGQGEFAGPQGRMHAFARLQKMRQIINDPARAGVSGPNPKVSAAMDLVTDMVALGRKGVVFCADRAVFSAIGDELDAAGIGWVGIWGSTPADARIANEKKFHSDPDTKVVLCTIQAGSESWSASPTATWLVSVSYMYAPSTLSQMEARVYRMNSDPDGPDVHICYVHATSPGGTLDDRMLEILNVKKQLFAAVVDRDVHVDDTTTHLSMQDLLYMLTGRRDAEADLVEQVRAEGAARERKVKERIKDTLYRRRRRRG